MRFMAMARVVWDSAEIEPYDMAPVEKLLMIDAVLSTSSRGKGEVLGNQLEETAQGDATLGLVVDEPRVLLEDVETLFARGVLELLDRAGVEEVELAVSSPLVLTVVGNLEVPTRHGSVGAGVQGQHGAGDVFQVDAADARMEAREVLGQDLLGDAHCFEEL